MFDANGGWHQRFEAALRGQAYHKTSSTKLLVNEESGYVQTWTWKDITLNLLNENRLYSEPSVVCQSWHSVETVENDVATDGKKVWWYV